MYILAEFMWKIVDFMSTIAGAYLQYFALNLKFLTFYIQFLTFLLCLCGIKAENDGGVQNYLAFI